MTKFTIYSIFNIHAIERVGNNTSFEDDSSSRGIFSTSFLLMNLSVVIFEVYFFVFFSCLFEERNRPLH